MLAGQHGALEVQADGVLEHRKVELGDRLIGGTEPPAQLKSVSSLPKRATAASTAARTLSSRVTSVSTKSASPPCAPTSVGGSLADRAR